MGSGVFQIIVELHFSTRSWMTVSTGSNFSASTPVGVNTTFIS